MLFLLGLATAPWAGIVTHLKAVNHSCCFLPQDEIEIVTNFKAVPFLLLLATTRFEIVTHFITGLRAVPSWDGYRALG